MWNYVGINLENMIIKLSIRILKQWNLSFVYLYNYKLNKKCLFTTIIIGKSLLQNRSYI